MEEKKTVFDYLAQVFVVFGFAMLVMNLLCLVLGESAAEISTMFALGRRGIPVEVVFQFLAIFPGGGGKVFVLNGCGDQKNATLAADFVYAGNSGCCDSLFCAGIWLVSGRYVAALGHVCSLFRAMFPGKLFCDDTEGEDGE